MRHLHEVYNNDVHITATFNSKLKLIFLDGYFNEFVTHTYIVLLKGLWLS